MKTLIISHRDADGITSAIGFAWNLLEKNNLPKEFYEISKVCDILDINYEDDFYNHLKNNNINLDNYNQIALLDFNLPIEIMKDLFNKFKDNFIWIDHHKRPDEDIEKEVKGIKGIRDSNHAACVLVWKYFNKGAPEFASYVEDMDIWKWELPNSEELISGLINLKSKYTTETLKYIFNYIDFKNFEEKKQKLIERGKIIIEHERNYVQSMTEQAQIVNFHGFKTCMINTPFQPSLIEKYFSELNEFKDISIFMVWYRLPNNKYKFSLRSNKSNADVSLIAKEYGGGGHKAAAGFIIDDINELKTIEWK